MERMDLHVVFSPFKRFTPRWLWEPMRRVGIAILGPALFSIREGHFYSSLRGMPIARDGSALPWYSYPAIDFLAARDFRSKRVLEFGAGQSSVWWGKRARSVLSLEETEEWAQHVRAIAPPNVSLAVMPMDSPRSCVTAVEKRLASEDLFDVVVIDGLFRMELIPVALQHVSADGIIVCDNADGYYFYEGLKDAGLMRVDFFGMAPGGLDYDCTSVFFPANSFVVDPQIPIRRSQN